MQRRRVGVMLMTQMMMVTFVGRRAPYALCAVFSFLPFVPFQERYPLERLIACQPVQPIQPGQPRGGAVQRGHGDAATRRGGDTATRRGDAL